MTTLLVATHPLESSNSSLHAKEWELFSSCAWGLDNLLQFEEGKRIVLLSHMATMATNVLKRYGSGIYTEVKKFSVLSKIARTVIDHQQSSGRFSQFSFIFVSFGAHSLFLSLCSRMIGTERECMYRESKWKSEKCMEKGRVVVPNRDFRHPSAICFHAMYSRL